MHYRKEIQIEQIEKDMRMCDMTISPKISTTTTFIRCDIMLVLKQITAF